MTAIVPDTLQGALIVSVIDFFLSFLIISGIGIVLSLFPLLNTVARFFGPRPDAAHAESSKAVPPAKAVESKQASAESLDDMAAIAAAVFVVMDGSPHRIINIEPTPGPANWAAEGRMAHHGSHSPVR